MSLALEYQEIMKTAPLFRDLNQADFLQIVENTSSCQLRNGETLFRQHDSAKEFFYVVKGKMKISLLSIEGSEKVVDIINEGNSFGEAIIFRGMDGYPVNGEALADSVLLRFNAATYIEVLSNSPKACIQVMARLSERLHWLMNEMERLSLHNATYRLISYLLENIPAETIESTEVSLSIPKHVVASRISVTPETLSRTLKRLSKEGLLEVHDKHIILINPVELRELVAI